MEQHPQIHVTPSCPLGEGGVGVITPSPLPSLSNFLLHFADDLKIAPVRRVSIFSGLRYSQMPQDILSFLVYFRAHAFCLSVGGCEVAVILNDIKF